MPQATPTFDRHADARARGPQAFDLTMPADLETNKRPASRPFSEPLRGLSMREVIEPDVFRHFFGATRF